MGEVGSSAPGECGFWFDEGVFEGNAAEDASDVANLPR
jgi:hypothetical protein